METELVVLAIADDLRSYATSHTRIPSHTRFAMEQLEGKLLKKFVTISPVLEQSSWQVFSSFNLRGRDWVIEPRSSQEEQVLDHVRFRFEQMLRPLEKSDEEWLLAIARRGEFGTGSSVGAEQNFFYKMLASKLTYSDPCTLVAYKEMCRERSSAWRSSEMERQYNFGCERTPYGTCTFVPKDTSKYRMVVTEPSLDMFFQRGFAKFIDDGLLKFYGIDIPSQEVKNQSMARIGSETGALSTIDSTSASDSIYLGALTTSGVLPGWCRTLLDTFKCRLIKYKSKTVKISMVGTQGCGFTFSLMTFLLASIVEGVYHTMGLEFQNGVNAGVYGDDIICDTKAYRTVIRALELFGLVPNLQKSFDCGPFRESCGGDYYSGHPVRPFNIKRLKTKQDISIVFNRLLDWSAMTGVPLLRTLSLLASAVGLDRKVPAYSSEDSGLRYHGIQGYFNQWLPRKPSMPMPDCHYDGRVQMSIYGMIEGNRVLCRQKDGDYVQYVSKRSKAVTSGYPPSWLTHRNRASLGRYSLASQEVWAFISG